MNEKSLEIALIQYNKKTWCKSAILGFFIGLAVIVPGISGSTVAIIFKLYDQFLYALGHLFQQFKKCFTFLLPIGVGAVVGVLLGFVAVKKLLALLPFAVVCLFAGLMIGAFPAVAAEIKGAEKTKKRIVLFALGLFIPIAVGCVSAFLGEGASSGDAFARIQLWQPFAALLIGAACGLTQIVPGLSATAILMSVGWFQSLVQSVSLTYWQNNFAIFFIYAALAIGFFGGVLTLSKVLSNVFIKARYSAYCMIVGLSLGSILAMFCNGDMIAVYADWAANGVAILDVVLGVVLGLAGAFIAYLLVRYQQKKDAENAKKQQEGV